MPNADPATRVARFCQTHPRRQAEFECASCGRPLCLTCAIPVRGRILGAECVRVPAGSQDAPRPEEMARRTMFLATGVGFAAALVGTILPWSAPNYSHYTGLFGGWGFSPVAWSLVAAAAAVVGLGAWAVAAARRASPSPALVWTVPAAGALTVVGTVLFIIWPPFATHPWLGPWITVAGATVSLVASSQVARSVRRERETAGS